MKRSLLTLLAVLLVSFTFAGAGNTTSPNLSGTVIDASTKKPLADVTIIATSSVIKGEQWITTDAQGNYRVSQLPQGVYTFKFSKEDYTTTEKKEVSIKSQTTTKMNIEMVAETLNEIESRRSWWDKFDIFL